MNRDNVLSMPTRNHRKGSWEDAESISGQVIEELGKERGSKMLPCMAGCIIKCAILFNDANGEHVTTALEFETIALLGSNLEIGPADAVAELDRLCDDIGLDTIEVGNAIGVAMEAGVLAWGDWEGTKRLLDEDIRGGTPLGRIIGGGTVHVANTYGIDRVPVVKGQGLPAWEPRTLKGMGITYSTSPQGADHTAGMVTARGATADTLVKQSRHEQLVMMAVDSVGVCQFTNALPGDMAAFISERFATEMSDERTAGALARGDRDGAGVQPPRGVRPRGRPPSPLAPGRAPATARRPLGLRHRRRDARRGLGLGPTPHITHALPTPHSPQAPPEGKTKAARPI